jgi:hypothetical protein
LRGRRWDRPVLDTEQIPVRQCVPRWPGRRRGRERGDGVWQLRGGHHCGRLSIDVGGAGFAERLGGEVEVGALAPVGVGERNGPNRCPTRLPSNFSRSSWTLVRLTYLATALETYLYGGVPPIRAGPTRHRAMALIVQRRGSMCAQWYGGDGRESFECRFSALSDLFSFWYEVCQFPDFIR